MRVAGVHATQVQLAEEKEMSAVPNPRPVSLIQVRSQRLFKVKAAARYVGVSPHSLKKYTDDGVLAAYDFHGCRVYKVEELDRFIDGLGKWEGRAEG